MNDSTWTILRVTIGAAILGLLYVIYNSFSSWIVRHTGLSKQQILGILIVAAILGAVWYFSKAKAKEQEEQESVDE